MRDLATLALAAIAEIVGCYLPYLWLRRGHSAWLVIPSAISLALFVWLLTQVSQVPGRTYAIYGVVYIGVSLAWLRTVDGVRPAWSDIGGVALAIAGLLIIIVGPSHNEDCR